MKKQKIIALKILKVRKVIINYVIRDNRLSKDVFKGQFIN